MCESILFQDTCEVYYDTPKLEYTDASIYGFYEKQNGTINDRNWYKNGGNTIWWEWYNSNITLLDDDEDGYGRWILGNKTKHSLTNIALEPVYFVAHTDLLDNGTDLQSADWRLTTEDTNENDVWNYAGKKLKIRCKYQPRRKCQLSTIK